MRKPWQALILLFVLWAFQSHVWAEAKTVRLLTIGNSFSANALSYLPALAQAGGHELILGTGNLGDTGFKGHWQRAAEAEKNPDDPRGKAYSGATLRELLISKPWDVITIQQVSYKSHDFESFEPYASQLHRYIQKHAPQAEVLVHQTWAYRSDDPWFVPKNKGRLPHTQRAMYQQVRAAYARIADQLGIGIIPSGDAMFFADTNSRWGYKPDPNYNFKNPVYPSLPDQSHSLHGGWRWVNAANGGHKLIVDGHHASRVGSYLLGCVWYEVLFGENVTQNTFLPPEIDAAYGLFLRRTAHRAVARLQREK